jgi:putative membrane protein
MDKTNHALLPQRLAAFSLSALIALCLAWELWFAPLREGGSWLALKALPLCLPLAGVLKGRVYTFQWSCMMILLYFAEAVMRLFDHTPAGRWCAAGAVVLSSLYFVSCLLYVKRVREGGHA